MTECESFGIANGCQARCPTLKKGECNSQREMEITFILSGEFDIEPDSPCIEEGCDGTYEFCEHNASHPTACWTSLECNVCRAEAPSREEILKRHQQSPQRTEIAATEEPAPAAAQPTTQSDAAELPIHRALRQHQGILPAHELWLPGIGGRL